MTNKLEDLNTMDRLKMGVDLFSPNRDSSTLEEQIRYALGSHTPVPSTEDKRICLVCGDIVGIDHKDKELDLLMALFSSELSKKDDWWRERVKGMAARFQVNSLIDEQEDVNEWLQNLLDKTNSDFEALLSKEGGTS